MRKRERSNVRLMVSMTHREYEQVRDLLDWLAEQPSQDVPATVSEVLRMSVWIAHRRLCRVKKKEQA